MKRVDICRAVVLIVLALFSFASVAMAENVKNSLTFSPMVGAHIFKPSEGFQNTGFVGMNFGYNFTKKLGCGTRWNSV